MAHINIRILHNMVSERFQVWAPNVGPYPLLSSLLGSKVWDLNWHICNGYIRIPDWGPTLRAHGLDLRFSGIPSCKPWEVKVTRPFNFKSPTNMWDPKGHINKRTLHSGNADSRSHGLWDTCVYVVLGPVHFSTLPRKTVAWNLGLLSLDYGLLWGIVPASPE